MFNTSLDVRLVCYGRYLGTFQLERLNQVDDWAKIAVKPTLGCSDLLLPSINMHLIQSQVVCQDELRFHPVALSTMCVLLDTGAGPSRS